jgi:hypothetical protein
MEDTEEEGAIMAVAAEATTEAAGTTGVREAGPEDGGRVGQGRAIGARSRRMPSSSSHRVPSCTPRFSRPTDVSTTTSASLKCPARRS